MKNVTYSEFLAIFCNCHPDAEGNRPCDNGCLCDKCMTAEAQEVWENIKTRQSK